MTERQSPPVNGARLSLQEVFYLRKQSELARLPFLKERSLPTLSTAMYQFAMSFENDLVKTRTKDSFDYLRDHILFVEGSPGAGKSYITRHHVLPYLESSARRWKDSYGVDVSIQHLHWDHIEEILEERGIIFPEEGKPFSKRDLEMTGYFVGVLAAYKMKKNDGGFTWEDLQEYLLEPAFILSTRGERPFDFQLRVINTFNYLVDLLHLNDEPSILVVEKPGPTALKYAIGWGTQTRHYNSRMIDDALQANPDSVFRGMDRQRHVIGAVGVVPGPNMNALVAYRAELQKTGSWQEANGSGINERYGIAPFSDEKEWKAARVGANLPIMEVASNAIRTVVSQMLSAAKDGMTDMLTEHRLPPYLIAVIRNNLHLLQNTEQFMTQLEIILNEKERDVWEKLKHEIDIASSYFKRSYPLMLWNLCFDLGAGLVMTNNFGNVDIQTIVYNNPSIVPRELITVPLYHQEKLF